MPGVAEASGVSLRTVYRYYPTREDLLEAAGRWIGDELLKHPYPKDLDEVADLYEERCRDFDERPGLVRALALSQLGRSVRGYRRRETRPSAARDRARPRLGMARPRRATERADARRRRDRDRRDRHPDPRRAAAGAGGGARPAGAALANERARVAVPRAY